MKSISVLKPIQHCLPGHKQARAYNMCFGDSVDVLNLYINLHINTARYMKCPHFIGTKLFNHCLSLAITGNSWNALLI